jgi:hypothetical protein
MARLDRRFALGLSGEVSRSLTSLAATRAAETTRTCNTPVERSRMLPCTEPAWR